MAKDQTNRVEMKKTRKRLSKKQKTKSKKTNKNKKNETKAAQKRTIIGVAMGLSMDPCQTMVVFVGNAWTNKCPPKCNTKPN